MKTFRAWDEQSDNEKAATKKKAMRDFYSSMQALQTLGIISDWRCVSEDLMHVRFHTPPEVRKKQRFGRLKMLIFRAFPRSWSGVRL